MDHGMRLIVRRAEREIGMAHRFPDNQNSCEIHPQSKGLFRKDAT